MGTTIVKEITISKGININKNKTTFRTHIHDRYAFLLLKRVFDVTLSLLVLLFIFSWLFPILFILIKIESRGPIFFVQKRVGFLGRSFSCLKFRTMYINADAHTRQATENDPRITRIGRFLRDSNLDEIPQFLNVLAGHMSIVGPRPHMHKDSDNFSRVVEAYKFRSLMKPGITGLAQVKGYRGPARDFDTIFRRYQWDAFYIRNANFWMDLRIVHKTALQTFSNILSKFVVFEDNTTPLVKEWIEPKNILN